MKIKIITAALLLFSMQSASSQSQETESRVWNLSECINYAKSNNIQIKQMRNNYLSGVETTLEARSAKLPSLTASSQQGFTNYPSGSVTNNNNYTGSYGINTSLTIYSGGRINNTIKLSELTNQIDELRVSESENSITIAIVQGYMQYLFSEESINVAEKNLATSRTQLKEAVELLNAGSISKVDFAQIESQCASNEYLLVVAKKNMDTYKLNLKQLLELDITTDISLAIPTISNEEILSAIGAKEDIYNRALDAMPEVKRGELAVSQSKVNEELAKAAFLPTLSLTGSAGTGHSSSLSGGTTVSGSQLWNSFNENIGVQLSVPIFTNRKSKSAYNRAKLSTTNSELEAASIEKELLRAVETAYLEVTSSQSQYVSAVEKQNYLNESYELVSEQFAAGIIDAVELLVAQNDYFNAQIEVLQAKYMTVMNKEVLNIYQGNNNF